MQNWRQEQLEYIKQIYKNAKKIAQEVWLDGDYEGTPNDFYYFQCGFAAGLNYENFQRNKDQNN